MEILEVLLDNVWLVGTVVGLAVLAIAWKAVFWLLGIVVVPDDSIGIVTKKFVLFGKNRDLPPGKIIALNGEAGVQAETLPPGLHLMFWPWQFSVAKERFTDIPAGHVGVIESRDGNELPAGRIIGKQVECDNFQNVKVFMESGGERGPQMSLVPPGTWRINTSVFSVSIEDMVTVPDGKVGVVEARDGSVLPAGRVLAKKVECDLYQDAKAFMESGGERGPQTTLVPAGQYRINPILFHVTLADIIDVPDNMVGIVTVKEGTPLETGEIAGPEVPGHNLFQDPQAFIENGGKKGLQEQVLLSGRYFINPKFATVEQRPQLEVPIASVGVVVAFVGAQGEDTSGDTFTQGNLVAKGEKGVWNDVLDPGKYPINPHTHKVEIVPTANVVLNWASAKTESHKLDANLSTITVRSADGFTFNLDVSQIIHIPRNDAPKVIARFGSMQALVTQVLEPMIGNYFRNAAQGSDVIGFLRERAERQLEAKTAITTALKDYNVQAVETLIGDIVPPDELMKTLTDRKVAEQQRLTFETQKLAEGQRQELEQATALADTQKGVVDAERQVVIAEYTAKAAVEEAKGAAEAKTINAKADAEVTEVNGDANASAIAAVGGAEAEVIKLKIASMGDSNYAIVQVAQAISEAGKAGMKVVPEILVSGGVGGNGGTLVDVLLANTIRDSMTTSKHVSENAVVASSAGATVVDNTTDKVGGSLKDGSSSAVSEKAKTHDTQ